MARVAYTKRFKFYLFDKIHLWTKVEQYIERSTDEEDDDDKDIVTLQERILEQ